MTGLLPQVFAGLVIRRGVAADAKLTQGWSEPLKLDSRRASDWIGRWAYRRIGHGSASQFFSSEFKRQLAKEFLDGRAGLHELARRHSLSRNLIRLWIRKYEAGEFTDELAERGVVGANRPNFANPLCARFPYVRPHAIGGVPIRGVGRCRGPGRGNCNPLIAQPLLTSSRGALGSSFQFPKADNSAFLNNSYHPSQWTRPPSYEIRHSL